MVCFGWSDLLAVRLYRLALSRCSVLRHRDQPLRSMILVHTYKVRIVGDQVEIELGTH